MNSDVPPGAPNDDTPVVPNPPDEEYPVDRLKQRVNESLSKRPLTVYLVLFAGAATLLLLLGVVWLSSRSGGGSQELICTEMAPNDARDAILAGQVTRITVLVDTDQPIETLTGIQLRFSDGTCRQTPQGADVREALFSLIGAVDLYNHYADETIDVRYQEQEIQQELLATSTSTALPTEEPTVTPTVPEPSATSVPPTATVAAPSATPSLSPQSPTPIAPAVSGSPGPQIPVGDPGS